MKTTRREILSTLGAAAALPWFAPLLQAAQGAGLKADHFATNSFAWKTFVRRSGEDFQQYSDETLKGVASVGLQGYEPTVESAAELDGLGERLVRHGLEMRSIYVNSVLHDEALADASIATALEIARAVKPLGTRIIVTNPSPLDWNGPQNKTDAQLRLQARKLDELGAGLRELGLALAYHNHDAELRQGGREFHHMLVSTDPANVKFCLDSHWIFRGCGNSEVAVFDAVQLYLPRIVELHLRQSTGGAWDEVFRTTGDIDYQRLFRTLAENDVHPHLVLEQAVEGESPETLDVLAAQRQSRENLAAAVA